MKKHLLWQFERGSLQWDIMCLLILAFMFLIPRDSFEDVPAFMKVSASERVTTHQDRGNTIFTVRLNSPVFIDNEKERSLALATVQQHLGHPVLPSDYKPIRDKTGRLIAYAIFEGGGTHDVHD
jgi:hypothetical protein